MHICGNQWVCVSNINCLPNSCNVYDSSSPKNPSSLTTHVAAIMKSKQPYFTMHHMNVQMQSVCKKGSSKYSFDHNRKRMHLKSCFEKASKKVPIYRPYNGTGNSVLFPFNFRVVAVLVRFQTVPVLSQGQPVRSGERPVRRSVVNSRY